MMTTKQMTTKKDQCTVVALYGLHTDSNALSHFHEELLQWFQRYGAGPDKMAIQGKGYTGKVGAFARTDSQLRKRGFDDIESIALFSMLAEGTIPVRDWRMTAEVALTPSCAVFAAHTSMVDEQGMLEIARRAIAQLQPDYGLGYLRESRLGPAMYGMGVSYGINAFSGPEYDESVNISRWGDTAMPQHIYREGILRDIYPNNFLTEAQLARSIEGVSLASWIQQDSGRGSLAEFQDNVSLWSLNDSEIAYVREVLEKAGFIFNVQH